MPFPSIAGSGYDDDQPYERTWGPPEAPPKETSSFKPAQSESPRLAPKIDTGAAPPNLSQFGEAKPQSANKNVPPGEQISAKEMPRAEGEFHGTDPFHGMLKSFGDQRAALDHIMPTDIHDPNYLTDLNSYRAARNAIKENEANFKQEHPWGSVDPETGVANHPGFWGKAGHVLGAIGNAAGQALAPGLAEAIPGSKLNLEQQKGQAEAGIKAAETEQSGIEHAQAAVSTAATKNKVADTQADLGQQNTDIKDRLATTHENPLQNQLGEAVRAGDTEKAQQILDMLKQEKQAAKPVNMQHVLGTDAAGKQVEGNYHPDTGTWTKDTGEEIPGFRQLPPQTPAGTLLVEPTTKPGAAGHVIQAKPGMDLPAGTQNVAGFSGLQRPTTQTRAMGEMAQSVIQQVPVIQQEVDRLAAQIGPGEGRWNQFWVNKGGIDDPAFAGLDTDLDLFASAVVRTHFGARGGQAYREELRKQFGEAQSPEDLKSRIEHADAWLQGYAHAGGASGKVGGGENAPAAGGNSSNPLNLPGF